MAELNEEASGAAERSRIVGSWDGLAESTQLFLRTACLFDTERIPRDALAALLDVEGWDADLFEIALDDACFESTLLADGELLRVPPDMAGFIRNEAHLRLPEDLLWAHLNGLYTAADAVCDHPSDVRAVERLLAYPLDREAWEGLGSDVDEALADLTQILGRCLLALDRPAQALRWYERALPHLERAAEEVDERTEHGAGLLTKLWEVLFQMGMVRCGADDDEAACLAREQACFERAADVAERLSVVDPRWLDHHGSTCISLVDLLLRTKRNEEALPWCDRALRALEASWAQGGVRSPRGMSSALPLAGFLAALDRDAEALVWFDRASADPGVAAEGDGVRWLLAATALGIGERLFFGKGEEQKAAALPWLERALTVYEDVQIRDASRDVRMGRALLFAGKLHFEHAKADCALLPTWTLPPVSVDLAHVAAALSYFERAAEFAEKADHINLEDRCFAGRHALSMGGLCHHQAGRPAEALASFERAEALAERLGAVKGLPVAYQLEELRVRSRCLDTLGRGEQATVYLERAVQLAIENAIADAAWEEGQEDFAALDAAEVQAELVELLDRLGASARAAPEHRVHALLFQAYGLAEQDRPEEAVRWFERAESPEGQETGPHTSRRIIMVAARAVMRSFARADRPEEAVAWYQRFMNAYSERMALSSAKEDAERARALVALHGNGKPFEFTLEKQVRGVLSGIRRLFEKIEGWSEESGESEDPEDALDDEDADDDDADDEDADDDDDARVPERRQ